MSTPDHNDTKTFPVWKDDGITDVQSLFQNPQFVPAADRINVGIVWYNCMSDFRIFLFDKGTQPNTVFRDGPAIYEHLGPSGDMPKSEAGDAFRGKFPPEALEQIRIWYNQGGRVTKDDPIPSPHIPADPISPPTPTTPPPARKFIVPAKPVWDAKGTEDDIKMCFQNPCWIFNGSASAKGWQLNMANFQYDATTEPPTMFDLQFYDHVKGWARNIYMHIASQAMPIEPPYFSDEALDAFRLWYNEGCPQTQADVGVAAKDQILPGPVDQPFKMRKDINTLSDAELTAYRMQLLKLNALLKDDSVWQTGGFLHANWCLHYMQASFPWHRAHLLWLETQLGGPIPYWNFFSSKATDPDSPDSGIPQAFLDDTFIDTCGKTQPNPLRHALARGGVSRASSKTTPISEVKRAQPFEQPNGPISRASYITSQQYVPTYLDQIHHATIMTSIGDPQGAGFAFTYSQADLTPDNLLEYYQSHLNEFDGALEQAHDNLHGWTGPDMANNSYAAFDPLFWSFHANFDRLFEIWLRGNPDQQWSSNFPLRPFRGRDGVVTTIEGDRRTYEYTNIGDMVMDSKALGYSYVPPGNADYVPAAGNVAAGVVAPIVFFPDVKCTDKTYVVHVALDEGDEKPLDFAAPGYIGSITRLGMGPDNGNDRCIRGGVLRRLEAAKAMARVGGLVPNSEVKLKMLVVENATGREVHESEYKAWQGFRPLVVWDKPVCGVTV